jgi:hypothetical protein
VQFELNFMKKINRKPSPEAAPFGQPFGQVPFGQVIHQPEKRQPEERGPEEKIFHLFDIADRYELDNIRKQLVAIIDANEVHIDPIYKILIGCKHDDARHWVEPTFRQIVSRPNGLTEDEMRSLGFGRVAEICTAREKRFHGVHKPVKSPNTSFDSVPSQAFYHAQVKR